MKKQELRKLYIQKRTELTDNDKTKLQESIYKQIFELNFDGIQIVHLFLSLKRFNEIDTRPIIDFLIGKNIKIVVPKCNFEDNTLSHYYFDENTKLVVNKFGVVEPADGKQVPEKKIDLIFVPLLISDENKYRVGYGKGFYDKFLANCRKDAKKIGLNFFEPINTIKDLHSFDISLDSVIFPKLA
jgi:5-formyltetrahydrofolate cyclo-ligase